jgi:type I restriction enzyme S subunit
MNSTVENTLPERWEVKSLADIGSFYRGVSYKKPQLLDGYREGCITLLRANNIQNGLFLENCQYLPSGFVKNEKLTKKGDVLIAMSSGSKNLVGKNVILPSLSNYSFGAFCSVFRLDEVEQSSFVSLYFQSHYYKEIISNLFRGAGINNLRTSDLEGVYIPIPPLEEQKRIVAKIDALFVKIDKAISLTEESLKQAKNLLPSVLKEIFEKGKADGWEEKKFGELFKDISSGFACSKRFEKDGGYVHLRTHNISTNGVLNFDKIIEIEKSKVNIRSSKIFKGDVIFNNTNSTELVGKTSYVDRDYDYGYSNHLTVIKTAEESEGKYLTYFLNHLQFTGYFMRICKKWIGQSGINTSMLKDLDYCYPPLEQQKKLVSILDGISNQSIKTQSKFEEQLSYLRLLKSSILSKAFKGEL